MNVISALEALDSRGRLARILLAGNTDPAAPWRTWAQALTPAADAERRAIAARETLATAEEALAAATAAAHRARASLAKAESAAARELDQPVGDDKRVSELVTQVAEAVAVVEQAHQLLDPNNVETQQAAV